MNIKNLQQGGSWGGREINELTLVSSIPKGINFNSKRIHMCLLRDRENLNRKCIRYFHLSSSKFHWMMTYEIKVSQNQPDQRTK